MTHQTADDFSPPPHPEDQGLPWIRALIDFDLHDPTRQVLGTDPVDLAGMPVEAVKTVFTRSATITIFAHRGEGQDVADLLQA